MKKLILLFVFISSFSFAQNKSIEVIVSDSIVLKPKFQVFLLKSIKDYQFYGEKGDADLKRKDSILEAYLTKNKYDFTKKKVKKKFSIKKYEAYNFFVQVSNTELTAFKEILEKDNLSYSAEIASIEFYEDPKSEEKLFTKLIKKAKEKAKIIASIQKVKLGEILQISEMSPNESVGIIDLIGKAIKMRSKGKEFEEFLFKETQGVEKNTIKVKFSVD